MSRPLFRTKPPLELVEKAARALGLPSLESYHWTSEKSLKYDLMSEVLEEVSQIMRPCFLETYLIRDPFEYKHFLVIVRQLLKTQGKTIKRKDKCETVLVDGEKTYRYTPYYTISRAFPPEEKVVVFD